MSNKYNDTDWEYPEMSDLDDDTTSEESARLCLPSTCAPRQFCNPRVSCMPLCFPRRICAPRQNCNPRTSCMPICFPSRTCVPRPCRPI